MHDVIDVSIENKHVNDVTEECWKNAHTIQNVISVDQLNDKTDEENLTQLRYWFDNPFNVGLIFDEFLIIIAWKDNDKIMKSKLLNFPLSYEF